MNNNITYDESQIRRDVDTAKKVVELLKKWRNEGEFMRDLINHDDETTCPNCGGVGRVMKTGKLDGTALANEHLKKIKEALKEPEDTCHDCNDTDCADEHRLTNQDKAREGDKRVSDLSIPEFKALMVDCFEMLKQRETDISVKEYGKITNDISTRNGVPVPKEY